jgi:hypothetical protein
MRLAGHSSERTSQARRTRQDTEVSSHINGDCRGHFTLQWHSEWKTTLISGALLIFLPIWCTLLVKLLGSHCNFQVSSCCTSPLALVVPPDYLSSFPAQGLSVSLPHPLHHSLASISPIPHHHLPSSMPQERGKSKRGARNHDDLSRKTRLTPSQRALIAHFASPHHSTKRLNLALLHGTSPVKLEAEASTAHYPPTLQPLCKVKEEAPPLDARTPLPTNLLAPPIIKPGDPYYGDGSCQVEEEIPPLATTPEDDMQRTKRQMTRLNTSTITSWRSTSTYSSKLDRGRQTRSTLNEFSAKGWTSFSRRSRMHRRMPSARHAANDSSQLTTSMVNPAQPQIKVTRFSFLFNTSCRLAGLASYNNLVFFFYYIFIVSSMIAQLMVLLEPKAALSSQSILLT